MRQHSTSSYIHIIFTCNDMQQLTLNLENNITYMQNLALTKFIWEPLQHTLITNIAKKL